MLARLRLFPRDLRGGIAPLGAIALVVAVGMATLAIDVGSFHLTRRTLQTTADLAAIAAAENLDHAWSAAEATVVANGWPRDVLVSVERGGYVADPAIAPERRFSVPASGDGVDAVRVRLGTREPMIFGATLLRLVGAHGSTTTATPPAGTTASPDDRVEIAVAATAAATRFASLSIGSRLLQIQGGLLDALLGALLGAEVSLSILDYEALAAAKIDLFTFSRALATRLGLEAITYDELLATDVRIGDLLAAAVEAARSDPNADATAVDALATLARATATVGTTVDLSRLLDFGPFARLPIDGKPLIGARVGALDLVQAVARVSDGTRQVAVALDLGIPSIVGATLRLAIGERPVGSPWFSIGSNTVTVHTAQVRLLLDLHLLGEGTLTRVHLPVYVEIAAATATLRSIDCAGGTAVAAARPAVIDAWIGDVDASAMTNMTTRPTPAPALLVDVLSLLRIEGRANVTITDLRDAVLDFDADDIATNTPQTVSTKNILGSLTSGLLGSLVLTVDGLRLLPLDPLRPLLTRILTAVTTPVDELLGGILSLLGVGIGQADVWVHGLRCDGAVVVN